MAAPSVRKVAHAPATPVGVHSGEGPPQPALLHPAHLLVLPLLQATQVFGWPNRCKLAHAFLWEYSYKRLKLDQLLGQHGVFLTWISYSSHST